MTLAALGDRAALFASQRHNADLRSRLAGATQELSTGQVADPARALRGDTGPLHDLDRRIDRAGAWGLAAREAGMRMAAMGAALGKAAEARDALAARLLAAGPAGPDPAADAPAAVSAFRIVVTALNARLGEGALFAGTATEGPALAGADAMLAALRAATAGQTTAAGVAGVLDAWFDDPAGGFAMAGYRGAPASLSRGLDDGEAVALPRADDPALRGLLKSAALGALAADLPGAEGRALLTRARDGLLAAADPLTRLRAALGEGEARAEGAAARHAARASAWGVLRQEMTAADPFEAASALEALRTRLETHYEAVRRLSSLSLVNHLR
jgi:flagellar hook-associated protein 3 FlgL